MNTEEAAARAWRAFEEGRLAEADGLWSELISSAETAELRDQYAGHRGYVLVAQGRFDEARAVYRELHARRGSHRDLHQIGMVEREAGNLDEALRVFRREAELLPPGDPLAEAANHYERALIQHRRGFPDESRELMLRCVELAVASGDLTTQGAAYRLKGDLLADGDPKLAAAAYLSARECFMEAQDPYGVVEVDRKIAALDREGG